MDFVDARQRMVDGQIRPSDVTDPRILAAMLDLPRERFVPPDLAGLAYADMDLPLTAGRLLGVTAARSLLGARNLAKMIQALDIQPQDRALDVGATTGYGAAMLCRLAGDVVALEEDPGLAAFARKTLSECGCTNVSVVTGPLTEGWPAQARYDAILVEGATEVAPRKLFNQLAEGGRLVCVDGRGLSGKATVYRAADGVVSGRPVFDAAAPLLPGFARPPAFVF